MNNFPSESEKRGGTEETTTHVAWGKLSRDEPEQLIGNEVDQTELKKQKEHSLLDHSTDVAACFTALSNCSAIRRALELTSGRELNATDLQRLAVLVYLHDIGKANCGFQVRKWKFPHQPPEGWTAQPCGHGREGLNLIVDAAVSEQSILSKIDFPLAKIQSWGYEATFALLQASISHHGRPLMATQTNQKFLWKPITGKNGQVLYDPSVTLSLMGKSIQKNYPLAFETVNQSLPDLPDRPAFVHFFAGLVQLSDWLGSDTREGFFSYSEPGENRILTAQTRANYAVRTVGLNVDIWRERLLVIKPNFNDAFSVVQARPMQLACADLSLGDIVVLEDETGSGKTEAALWRFVQLFLADKVDSLYFALPTRAAASQIYKRIFEFVNRLWPNNAPVVVRALPGDEAADNQTKISLPDFTVLWQDSPDDEKAHQRWIAENPKRFLAATIAIGTIDQVLLGALKVKHAHMRHALLARSMLVVDEVHASDAYMTVLLEKLLQTHVRAGGQAMLLSATLGASARTRYLNIGNSKLPKIQSPLLEATCAVPYPSISCRSKSGICLQQVVKEVRAQEGSTSVSISASEQKTVHWQTLDAIDDPMRIAAVAAKAASQGARVLVIRNTVASTVATLKALEELFLSQRNQSGHDSKESNDSCDPLFRVNGVSTVHHSRYGQSDRHLLNEAVEAQLGKKRHDYKGRIIIGTQTLEQSLDIDADLLICDLCPMDVILQRVGRLHRHRRAIEERPENFRLPTAWVLTPKGNDITPMLYRSRNGLGLFQGGGGVYPDLRIIELTKRLIEAQPSRQIPAENRFLVEHATNFEALQAIEKELDELSNDQPKWQEHGQKIEGEISAMRSIGSLHTLPYESEFGDVNFENTDQKIATRLGAADRLVKFDPPQVGPFGQKIKQLALRYHQLPKDTNLDEVPTHITILPEKAGFEFNFGKTRYCYNRFGLEKLKIDS